MDPHVAWVRQALLWFRSTYQDRIDSVLGSCEAELQRRIQQRELKPAGYGELLLQLFVVSLRHAPNVFFERLLTAARSAQQNGRIPDIHFGDLLPLVGPEGEARVLDAALERTEQLLEDMNLLVPLENV